MNWNCTHLQEESLVLDDRGLRLEVLLSHVLHWDDGSGGGRVRERGGAS